MGTQTRSKDRRRSALIVACLVAAWHLAAAAEASRGEDAARTFYVRTDGGTAAQCDGLHDTAYEPVRAHKRRACAWSHPFYALPPAGKPRIRGGDTLIIASGAYMMGLGAPEATGNAVCYAQSAYTCMAAPVPSGPDAAHKTRILGRGFDQGCAAPPQLWGTERAYGIVNLTGSSNVEVACLELTDHSDCIDAHCHGNGCPGKADQVSTCEREHPPFGTWAAAGITASDSADVTLRQLDIHGLANYGVHAGRLRDWTIEEVRIHANGWGGWNGDIDEPDPKDPKKKLLSSNAGTLHFDHVEIAWNGCGERYPGNAIFGCWAQQEGGYGDGLGTEKTGGDWTFDSVRVHDNTSDGIDLLYADGSGKVVVRNSYLWNNAGNQLKIRGSADVIDSTVVGSCSAFRGRYLMSDGDLCRAYGNALVIALGSQQQALVSHDDLRGDGDCVAEFGCSGAGCQNGSRVRVQGSSISTLAEHSPQKRATCVAWIPEDFRGADIRFTDNRLYGSFHNGPCPSGARCSGQTETKTPLKLPAVIRSK